MAKLCYASDLNGKEAWVETGTVHFVGYKAVPEHKLFHGVISVFEFDGRPYVRVTANGEDVMTMSAEMEREDFAVWDEKPEEPFFSDGWPRLAELQKKREQDVQDDDCSVSADTERLYQEVTSLFAH